MLHTYVSSIYFNIIYLCNNTDFHNKQIKKTTITLAFSAHTTMFQYITRLSYKRVFR